MPVAAIDGARAARRARAADRRGGRARRARGSSGELRALPTRLSAASSPSSGTGRSSSRPRRSRARCAQRTRRCSSTPASTTTTRSRRSSSTSSACRGPSTSSASAAAPTPRRPRACWPRSRRCSPPRRPTSCSSTATRTRRSPAAWPAAQARVPVAHVEAGMRSYDRAMPEELNRVLTDHLVRPAARARSRRAADNLAREGVAGRVEVVGDVMVDVAQLFAPRARGATRGARAPPASTPGEYVLATAHRAGNVDDPARLRALVDAAARRCPRPVVLPLHPRTRARLDAAGLLAGSRRAPHVACAAARLPRRSPRCCCARARCSPTPAACRRRPTSPACRA